MNLLVVGLIVGLLAACFGIAIALGVGFHVGRRKTPRDLWQGRGNQDGMPIADPCLLASDSQPIVIAELQLESITEPIVPTVPAGDDPAVNKALRVEQSATLHI